MLEMLTASWPTLSRWEQTLRVSLSGFTLLETVASDNKIDTFSNAWPKSASILSRRLREVQPNLEEAGIKYVTKHNNQGSHIEIKNQKYNEVGSGEAPMENVNNLALKKRRRIAK